MQVKNVLIYSGGLDSSVLLHKLLPDVRCLLFNYGQRHKVELKYAIANCNEQGVKYKVADLQAINHLLNSGSQTGNEPVPEGHYTEESMKATIVPNRNMIMLSIAIGYAVTIGAQHVYYAAHRGDHAIYPDCRPEFVRAMNYASTLGNAWSPVDVNAPFIKMSKAEIVALGISLGVPFATTWSCYKGGSYHCGLCGTCVERREAFQLAGVTDPTKYEV